MINTTLTEREFITAFIMYAEECGYGSAYNQRECINSFLARLPLIEKAQNDFKISLNEEQNGKQ